MNPAAVSTCQSELDLQAQNLDNLVASRVLAIGGNFLGSSDNAVQLAKTLRAFDRTAFSQLGRAAGLIRAAGDAAGSGTEMLQEMDRINARSVGRHEPV